MIEGEVKLRKVKVNTNDFIKKVIPEVLEKDLYKDEQICEVCGGIGMVIEDYPFYMRNNEMYHRMEKYNKPHLKQCPACYNGVQQICEYCGKPKAKFRLDCNCEGYKKYRADKKQKKINQWYEKAEKITLEEAAERDIMLYDEYSQDYYTIDDIYDRWPEEKYGEMPKWMFGTSKVTLVDNLDAYRILENATEDLHEDAYDLIDADELQDILDKWTEKQPHCTTYYVNHKLVVLIEMSDL